jgi:hypothetical protein
MKATVFKIREVWKYNVQSLLYFGIGNYQNEIPPYYYCVLIQKIFKFQSRIFVGVYKNEDFWVPNPENITWWMELEQEESPEES